jgi:hypothetical protein
VQCSGQSLFREINPLLADVAILFHEVRERALEAKFSLSWQGNPVKAIGRCQMDIGF